LYFFAHLNRTVVEHLRAERREFEHLVVGNILQFLRTGHLAGIRGIHPFDVGVNLAQIGVHLRRDGHCAGIRTAAAERSDIPIAVEALETGDYHNAPLIQRSADALRRQLLDPGSGISRVGIEARLPAEQRDG